MRPLHARLYVHFLGVLVVVGLAAAIVFAIGTRDAPWRDVAELVARHVASLVAEVWGDQDALARRLQQLHDTFEADLIVREIDGRVVAKLGRMPPALTAAQAREVREGR